MMIASFILFLAASTVDLDIVAVPLTNDIKILLTPAGRSELKRDGNVIQVKIEIDRIAAPNSLSPAFNSYVVWSVSPEGIFDNLGQRQIKGNKGQFTASTRFGQLGV